MQSDSGRSSLLMAIAGTVLACGLAGPGSARAFGPEGHEIVALIADRLLDAPARRQVDAILAVAPGATLASISSWADRSRDRSSAAWHYVNMRHGTECDYVPARDCPGDQCVIGALRTQVDRLGTATGQDQLDALALVVHFVADLHQPLHAGSADDKGGNTFQLRAFGEGTNLHALWDSGLIRHIDPDASTFAAALMAMPLPMAIDPLPLAAEKWARESCEIVGGPGFYPSGRTLREDDAKRYGAIVRDRLLLAGTRLAALLNGTLKMPNR